MTNEQWNEIHTIADSIRRDADLITDFSGASDATGKSDDTEHEIIMATMRIRISGKNLMNIFSQF